MEDIEEGVEGYDDERSLLMCQKSLEKRIGQSPVFIAATFMEQGGIPPTTNPASLLKEAIHVISCGYEDNSRPFVEYKGTTHQHDLQSKQKELELELEANALVSRGGKVSVAVLPYREASDLCGGSLPDLGTKRREK